MTRCTTVWKHVYSFLKSVVRFTVSDQAIKIYDFTETSHCQCGCSQTSVYSIAEKSHLTAVNVTRQKKSWRNFEIASRIPSLVVVACSGPNWNNLTKLTKVKLPNTVGQMWFKMVI